jgi:selenide, water dikinase
VPRSGYPRRGKMPTVTPTAPLTSLAKGAGCGCKLPAVEVLSLAQGLPLIDDERVLVGAGTSDDAGVYRLSDELALVQTVDFFTPPVDDPYDFGRIAAANALSDVYAMGARPLTALNVLAFPLERIGGEALRSILAGGLEVAGEAGVAVIGGHSIEDDEPKYGMAVTGVVDPRRVLTNAGARAGDVLVLTKPLGTGAAIAAERHEACPPGLLAQAVATMAELNAGASAAALDAEAHAMTDVTGFGLLGHLHHICRESSLAAELRAGCVPALAGVRELLEGEAGVSGGSRRNAAWAESFTRFEQDVEPWRRRLLCDATTSGGLLAAVPAGAAEAMPGTAIGRLRDGPAGTIFVRG